MGVYLPDGLILATAQKVIDKYEKVFKELGRKYYSNYSEQLEFTNPLTFKLKYIPAPKKLKIFINGILYLENIHYDLDRENKIVTWKFTENENGFNLENDNIYFATYDVYYDENGLLGDEDIS